MRPIIEVDNLQKRYRFSRPSRTLRGLLVAPFGRYQSIEALAGISFNIQPGERVAILGPNGAGKSTTLKILTGILEPTSGLATVLDLTPWRDRQRLAYQIGVVFGHRSQLWNELPVRDSFVMQRHIYGQDAAIFASRLWDTVERLELGPLLDQPVNRLSLGQRMRCELAASMLHGPSLLFLDEPTIGLDITAKAVMRDIITEQAQAIGQTVILTSHDTRDIELVCDRVIVINGGRIVVDQPMAELRRRYLRHKLVPIRSAGASVALDLPGVTQRVNEAHRALFEFDTSLISAERVIEAALNAGEIEDITIEDPPMEEIIREIYAIGGLPTG
ncbi:MAG: ATP-binding cassette domain-containing protein [Acetobacteraceae bacterium]|nr:ATP-binding cassette domain-containing protein [Acetobacteraceae bacterium]